MPRNYIRKTTRGHWTKEQLANAVSHVRDGLSIRKAAVLFDIPYSSLRERLAEQTVEAPRFGTKPVFSVETESEIAGHCVKMANLFFGLTKEELRKAVYDYAEKKGIPHRFNNNNKLAGKDWLDGFLQRHPGISVRKPEATSINRIKAFNKVEVSRFYKNLQEVLSQYNFQADRIYNFDETGKNLVHKPKAIIAKKGMKRVGAATSGERGKNHTVACAVSAAGHYIPPMIIFPRVRMTASLMIDGPPGTIYKAHKTGWMTEELFVEWLVHFKDKTNASTQYPVLLILDNHSTHCSVEAFDFCTNNGIVMLSIPPHTSHRLQPLDLTIFGPLSTAFNDACDTQMKANGYMAMTSEQLPSLLKTAWNKICSTEKAVNGFQSAGICPYNPNVFSDDEFYVDPELEREDTHISEPSADCVEIELEHLEMDGKTEQELVTDGFVIVEPIVPVPIAATDTKFCDIIPVPSASGKKKSNRKPREKQHSEIMTSPQYKKVLDEKRNRRDLREQKKQSSGKSAAVPKKRGRPKKSESGSVESEAMTVGVKMRVGGKSERGTKKDVGKVGTDRGRGTKSTVGENRRRGKKSTVGENYGGEAENDVWKMDRNSGRGTESIVGTVGENRGRDVESGVGNVGTNHLENFEQFFNENISCMESYPESDSD